MKLRTSSSTRAGRKVPRTLYLQTGPAPDDADPAIGQADTPEIAALVVHSVNAQIARNPADAWPLENYAPATTQPLTAGQEQLASLWGAEANQALSQAVAFRDIPVHKLASALPGILAKAPPEGLPTSAVVTACAGPSREDVLDALFAAENDGQARRLVAQGPEIHWVLKEKP